MSTPGNGEKRGFRRLLVDTTPLKVSPAFARLWIGNSISQIGSQMTVVAVGLHIYALTGSTLAVAFVALWALGPMILAGFVGGALSDMFDRRKVALVTSIIAWLSISAMTVIAFVGVSETWPYYALAALNAASATIMGTARGSIYPRLIAPQLLPAAAALNGITMGVAVTVGPALAGVLVAFVGVPWTFLVDVLLFTAGFLGIVSLPQILPSREQGAPSKNPLRAALTSAAESIHFLRHAPNVRATFVWDIIAMTLGQPRVVFPAAGVLVLGGGAVTVGLLTAAFAIGSLLSSLFSGPLGGVRRQGRAVTISIAAYGVATLLFGVVLLISGMLVGTPLLSPLPTETGLFSAPPMIPAIVLACLALAGAGAADNVSAVFRSTILQSAAPDHVIGRMQGLFYVVVTGGPRVGDLFAGVLATVIAIWAPAFFGGILIVVLMLVLLRTARGFQAYDGRHPQP
ncbi:MAG: MFS transporter [Leucobacter sp.]